MNKTLKIILIVLAVAIVAGGNFYLYQKYFHKKTNIQTNNLPGQLFGPKSPTRSDKLEASKIIYWTNKYRADEKLPALTNNDLLTSAAEKKVADMFTNQYFEHNSPNGITPSELVSSVGYNYKTTGENLALGDFKDEKDLVDAWMASPGHRANILNPEYTEIGVASSLGNFEDRTSTWISVQEFGRPLPNCTKPSEELASDIDTKKSSYTATANEAQDLFNQANAKIAEGNSIYASTGDSSQAQPYWNEGESLRTQGQTKADVANAIQQEIDSLVNDYNTQVSTYNTCTKQ